jgi:hypothetical protein
MLPFGHECSRQLSIDELFRPTNYLPDRRGSFVELRFRTATFEIGELDETHLSRNARGLLFDKLISVRVLEFSLRNQNKICELPYTTAAEGDQFNDAKSDIAEIKAVDAKSTDK